MATENIAQEQEAKRPPLYERLRCLLCYGTSFDEFDVPKEARATFWAGMGAWAESGAHGFLLEPDGGDGHCDPEFFVETLARRMDALCMSYNGKRTQSPIEDMMIGALLWLEMDWAGFPAADLLNGPEAKVFPDPPVLEFMVTPQAKVAGYSVDFCAWFKCGRHVAGVVIECDGHAFHEKTKEQAARDKSRDRKILLAGFPTMRFSGSEIYRDLAGCIEQVREALSEQLDRVSRDGGVFG